MPRNKTITVECNDCGERKEIPARCPYLGYEYGRGWVVRCMKCGGETQEVKNDPK